MTRHLRVLVAFAGLSGLAACERVVDLIGIPDGGINLRIDAGSLDVGSGYIDTGVGDGELPGDGGLDPPPDAVSAPLDGPFVGPVRTRT